MPVSAADSASRRKARGAFFTPESVARFLVDWAVRTPGCAVLERSCGESGATRTIAGWKASNCTTAAARRA